MRYDVRGKQGPVVWALSSDGVIRQAHDLIRWCVGQKVGALMSWCALKKLKVYVTPENGGTRKIDLEPEEDAA